MHSLKTYRTMFREYDDLLPVSDVIKILKIDRHQVYQLIKSDQIQAVKPGNAFLIPKMLLIDYVMGFSSQIESENA